MELLNVGPELGGGCGERFSELVGLSSESLSLLQQSRAVHLVDDERPGLSCALAAAWTGPEPECSKWKNRFDEESSLLSLLRRKLRPEGPELLFCGLELREGRVAD